MPEQTFSKGNLFYVLFSDNSHLFIGIDLYLVPKSHPKSENRWAEWRLSFSMVEIVLMKHLPFVHRKDYLCCKHLIKGMRMDNFESYVLKTVMLWNMDECNEEVLNADEESLYQLVHALLCKLIKGYKDKVIQHYFLPDVNLLGKYSSQEYNSIYEKLKECQEDKQFVDIVCSSFGYYAFHSPSFDVLLKTFLKLEICDAIRCAIVIRQCYILFLDQLFHGLRVQPKDESVFRLFIMLYQIKVFSNRSGLCFINMSLDDIWVLCQSLFKFVKSLNDKLPEDRLLPQPCRDLKQNPYCIDPFINYPLEKSIYIDSNTIEQRFDQKIKIVEDAMKNEWWDYDEIFASLVSWINQEALNIPEDISLKFHNLSRELELKMQIEMFNFGLTNEMFGFTTLGKYLLFLTQDIFNNRHIYDKGMIDSKETFWAFFIPGKRKELQRYDRKNSIIFLSCFENEGKYDCIPRVWLDVHNNWSIAIEWTHTLNLVLTHPIHLFNILNLYKTDLQQTFHLTLYYPSLPLNGRTHYNLYK